MPCLAQAWAHKAQWLFNLWVAEQPNPDFSPAALARYEEPDFVAEMCATAKPAQRKRIEQLRGLRPRPRS